MVLIAFLFFSNKFLIEEDSVIPIPQILKQINSSGDLSELKDFLIKNYILTDLKKKFLKYGDGFEKKMITLELYKEWAQKFLPVQFYKNFLL